MIGGKVVDPSALAAHVGGSFAMATWLAVAKELGIVLYLPALAMVEVRAVYPDADTPVVPSVRAPVSDPRSPDPR